MYAHTHTYIHTYKCDRIYVQSCAFVLESFHSHITAVSPPAGELQ